MEKEFFSIAMEAVRDAGSKDPRLVAKRLGIIVINIYGSIAGYATVYRTEKTAYPVIGLHQYLKPPWDLFGGWHELAHVLDGQVFEPGFANRLIDKAFFTEGVDSQTIPCHEKRANLMAADVCIDDDDILDLIGYHNQAARDYRTLKSDLERLVASYDRLRISTHAAGNTSTLVKVRMKELQKKIRETQRMIMDLTSELSVLGCATSIHDLASQMNLPERILQYKMEALRLKGYDVSRQELEKYNKMFKGVL